MSLVLKGVQRCSPAHATWTSLHRPPVAALVAPQQASQAPKLAQNSSLETTTIVTRWKAVAQHTLSCPSTNRLVAVPSGSLSDDTFLVKLKQGRITEALQQFESICALGVYPSNNSCQKFIAGLCKRRRPQEAWRAFVAIEGSTVRLNSPVAHMLCKACLTRNKPAHALRVYRAFLSSTGASANTFLATTIISHLLKLPSKGTPHKATALELWQQLLSTGEPLDAAAYRAGLNLMVELGRLPQAEALLSRMQAAGVAPTAQCYNILLKFHCQRGDVAAAQRLFKRMRQLQIPPDAFTYNTLMMAFVAVGEPVRARAVLDKARREGVPVDVVSYTSLLQGLARAQQAEAAEQLLLEMQQAGLAPNAVTWGTLANMYADLGQIDTVRGVLHRMQQAGQPPSTIVYNTLLKALLRQSYSTGSSSSEAEGSSSEAAAPDAAASSSSSSSSIFTAGSSDSNGAPSSNGTTSSSSDDGTTAGPLAAEVSELLRSMASQGLAPGVDSYTILLDALLELPDPASASRVFETLLQQGLQPDGVLLTCLMKLHMVNGQPLAAIKAFNQISSSPTAAVDLPAWCALVDALAGSGRMSEAEQAAERALDFATAQALLVQATLPAFGALVKGYYWQRQVDPAVRVFKRFLQLGGKPHAAMLAHVVKLCASSGEFRTARQLIRATELVGVQVDRQRFDELIDRGQDRWQRSRQQQAQPPGLQEGSDLEKWKWWLGLPNKYYNQE